HAALQPVVADGGDADAQRLHHGIGAPAIDAGQIGILFPDAHGIVLRGKGALSNAGGGGTMLASEWVGHLPRRRLHWLGARLSLQACRASFRQAVSSWRWIGSIREPR